MKVLVPYASRHGSTVGIAERIAAALTSAGMIADAQPVEEVSDVAAYDAFVVGAAYMFHWLKDAGAFVKRHREVLQSHPLWLFSSGEKSPLQAGDFRDWAAIDAWANDVATLLRAEPASSR